MILITGFKGFIGSYLVKFFENESYNISKVSLSEMPINEIQFSNVEVILHLSGLAHQSKTIPYEEYKRINALQSYELALQSKKENVRHFIYCSSIKVYGESGSLGIEEDSLCIPSTPYGKSKLLAEEMINSLADDTFSVTIIRLPLVYGESLKGNLKLLSLLIRFCPFLPFSGIENKRMMISLKNLGEVIRQVIVKNIVGIIVPSDRELLSTTEIIGLMSKAIGKKVFLFKLPRILQSLLMRINSTLYNKLFASYYIDNSRSMKRIDKSKFISVYEEFRKI